MSVTHSQLSAKDEDIRAVKVSEYKVRDVADMEDDFVYDQFSSGVLKVHFVNEVPAQCPSPQDEPQVVPVYDELKFNAYFQ